MATHAPPPSQPGGFKLSSVRADPGLDPDLRPPAWLRPDILAGVTVAAFSVPESMAYAGLAGLTPEHGLYASMMALLV